MKAELFEISYELQCPNCEKYMYLDWDRTSIKRNNKIEKEYRK